MTMLAVMLAGALGAVARFVLDGAIKSRRPTTFPLSTWLINVVGSLVLGFVAGLVMFHAAPDDLKAIVGTGFCGGFTTFSTASVETVRLAQTGKSTIAAVYALGSLLVSVAACAAGLALAWLV